MVEQSWVKDDLKVEEQGQYVEDMMAKKEHC